MIFWKNDKKDDENDNDKWNVENEIIYEEKNDENENMW